MKGKPGKPVGFGIPDGFYGLAQRLTDDDINAAAVVLGVESAIVHAFSDVESGSGGGFLPTGEPVILFEARYFHLFTNGQFDSEAPNVSSPTWDRSLYGKGGQHQYSRLRIAMALDAEAALKSCSIGRYQIMASNFAMLGFQSVAEMWTAFCESEVAHLRGFVSFCRKKGLVSSMQRIPPDFVALAVGYNGASESANHYHQKIEASWRYWKTLAPPTQRRVLHSGHRPFAQSRVTHPETIGLPIT